MQGITFVGAGALAQAIGAHLAPHIPVTLVASARTAATLRESGEIVVRGQSTASATVRDGVASSPGALGLIDNPADAPAGDVLIFTTKGPQLQDVVAQINPEGRTGGVAGLQNGVVKDDVLAAHFGASEVIGAVTLFNARREDGAVVVGGTGFAYFGERSGGTSPRVDALVAAFRAAGLNADAAEDITSLTWMKFVNALGIFGASTLTRRSSSAIMRTPELVTAYLDILAEAAAVATAEGAVVGDHRDIPMGTYLGRPAAEVRESIVTAARAAAGGAESISSMAQDVIGGRATESAETFGDIVARAERHGITVPRLTLIRDLLAGHNALSLI